MRFFVVSCRSLFDLLALSCLSFFYLICWHCVDCPSSIWSFGIVLSILLLFDLLALCCLSFYLIFWHCIVCPFSSLSRCIVCPFSSLSRCIVSPFSSFSRCIVCPFSSLSHCIVCPVIYHFWLPLCLSCNLPLLITPLVSFGHCIVCPVIYDFWLPLWYLLAIVLSVLWFTTSDCPFGIFWPLYFLSCDLPLLITPLVSFGHCIVCPAIYHFWLPLWYLLVIALSVLRLTTSDYPFGIFKPLLFSKY